MTQRLILAVLVIGVGYYILGDLSDLPSSAERALESHRDLMDRFNARN